MSGVVLNIVTALVLTLIIETVIAYLFKFKSKDELSVIVYMNLITNPTLNFILLLVVFFYGVNYVLIVIILEIIVVLVEFLILNYVFKYKYGWKKLLLLAFILNVISFTIGALITPYFYIIN